MVVFFCSVDAIVVVTILLVVVFGIRLYHFRQTTSIYYILLPTKYLSMRIAKKRRMVYRFITRNPLSLAH